MKTTYIPNKETIEKKWVHIDAKGKTLGRLAVSIANVLRGKNKPTFTPHVDCGDFVVVTNADKFVVTGKKMEDKIYASHSGYPGGFKKRTLRQMLEKNPEKVLEKAVKGMLPHNRLGAKQFSKLNVYTTDSHPHAAQQPKTLELSERGELLNNG